MPAIPPRKALMNPELRRRGIYLLPNLLTTAALFSGFYAIVQAMTGRREFWSGVSPLKLNQPKVRLP